MLYHGSNEKFDKFKIRESKNGTALGFGIYLTDSPERAKTYGKYIYQVQLTDDPENREVSTNKVTLNQNEVTKMIEAVAQKQIDEDGYPYILSDWEEPSSETEIDEGNHMIAQNISENIVTTNESDIDIINDLGNQVGGRASASECLSPILKKMHIHYSVKDFQLENGDKTKEYIVFNPKDIQISSVSERNLSLNTPNKEKTDLARQSKLKKLKQLKQRELSR